jgi:hypothetical protein
LVARGVKAGRLHEKLKEVRGVEYR